MKVDEKSFKCKAIIFDLDGTLLDTLTDIADAANQALIERGYPSHKASAYRLFVGDGARQLMTRALPAQQRHPEIIDACYKAYIRAYQRNWAHATQPYSGILDLLDALVAKGIQLAVVTNKPHRFTNDMMQHYFQDRPFDPILGQMEGVPKKPHPQLALRAASEMDVHPTDCIFIGDSGVDMQTACRAAMIPIGAAWGFRSPQELYDAGALVVIERPLELLNHISAHP